jgi:hypothetical protein
MYKLDNNKIIPLTNGFGLCENNLPSGVYFVTLIQQNGNTAIKKIIVH